jgi:ATP-dependent Lon protease
MSTNDTPRLLRLPLFPLPDFFLFPGAVTPLHIFERRYRQMIDDLLDTSGRLVVAAVRREHAHLLPQAPPVFPVGALGEIIHFKKLENGRYLIWLMGLGRVTMEEVTSDRLYRRVDARILEDDSGSENANRRLAPHLVQAIAAHEPQGIEVSEDLPAGLLADILLQHLRLQPDQLARAFEERNITRRAGLALAWHRLEVDYADKSSEEEA